MNSDLKLISCLIIFLTINNLKVVSQDFEFRFKHLTNEDGLTNSIINAICKDSTGFMWFASSGGLHRYDGYDLKVYKNNPDDSSSIAQNSVKSIYVDAKNRVWLIFSKPGLSYYDNQTGNFVNFYPSEGKNNTLHQANVNCVFQDKKGKIWIGTDKGLCVFNEEKHQIERIKKSNPGNFSVASIIENSNGLLWFVSKRRKNSEEGILVYHPEKEQFFALNTSTNSSLEANNFTTVFEDSKQNIWIGTDYYGALLLKNGYSVANINEWKFSSYLDYNYIHPYSKRSSIISIYETSHHDIWFSTNLGLALLRENHIHDKEFEFFLYENSSSVDDNPVKKVVEDSYGNVWGIPDALNIGLFRYNYSDSTYKLYKNEKYNPYSVSSNKFDDIYIDNQDIIWIASDNNGVDILDLNQKRFSTYRYDLGINSTLSSNKLFGMTEDKQGNIWIASYNGLNKLNPQTNTVEHFNNQWKPGFFNQNEMFEVYCDVENKLWIGYLRIKISRFDPENQTNEKFIGSPHDSSGFSGWSVREIIEDKNHNVWIGTKGEGLWKYDRKKNKFNVFTHNHQKNSISGNQIFAIHEDKKGIFWIATHANGLNKYNPETGKFKVYRFSPESHTNHLLCIAASNSSILWLGTVQNGLIQFDTQTERFKNYTTKDGLCDNHVKGILIDDKENLWISTNNGLSNFNTQTETFNNYTKEDGIQGNEFNILSYHKSRNGIMFFGGTNGLTVFNPSEIKKNPYKSVPLIYRLMLFNESVGVGEKINNQVILQKSLPYTDSIELNHQNNVFSLGFTALHYSSPSNIVYHYKLVGFDYEWNIVDANRRIATYTNLDPGDYTFKVKATNNDGILNNDYAALHITILPAWWETRLFKLVIIFVFLFVAFLWMRLRTYRLKNQKIALKKEVSSQTKQLFQKNEELVQQQTVLIKKNKEISDMSAKIHELDQSKLKFFTNISHELRTPLTLMLTPTEKMLESPPETRITEVKKSLELLYKNELRLLHLINQLLEIRKIETGTLLLKVQNGNPLTVLEEIADLFIQVANENSIDYKSDFYDFNLKPEILYFDKDKIEKIAYNLISNAFKFTKSGDKIWINGVLKKQYLILRITDTGIGIKSEYIDAVFERFSNINQESHHIGKSAGIGLSYVKDLVKIHKGKITVESRPRTETVFEVKIPVLKSFFTEQEIITEPEPASVYGLELNKTTFQKCAKETIDSKSTEINQQIKNSKPSLLIVEDNDDLRNLLIDYLQEFFIVEAHANGQKGLTRATQNMPDILLSDVMIPGIDGIELCNRIKSSPETSHIPVVLLTAKITIEDQLSGIHKGADDYITKPFNIKVLIAKLINLVVIRQKLKEQFSNETSLFPETLAQNNIDKSFICEVVRIIKDNIDDNELNAQHIARQVNISRSLLYNKIKALSGKTVNEFIRVVRLKAACELMKNTSLTLSEIAYKVGFTSLNYFSRSFKKQFNQLPSEFQKENQLE